MKYSNPEVGQQGLGSNRVLEPRHVEYFAARAIPVEVALEAPFFTVDGGEAARLLGRATALRTSGIAMPYPNAEGYTRIRPDDPDVHGRYLSPGGVDIPVYLPVTTDLSSDTVIVVESPVKAVALAATGFAAVGLGGVDTTLDDGHLNASWCPLPLDDRRVVVMFDTNRASNFNVMRAESRIAEALGTAGANVRVARLDRVSTNPNDGPDDILAKHGKDPIEEAVRAAIPAAFGARIAEAKDVGEVLRDLPLLVAIVVGGPAAAAEVKSAFKARRWPLRELDAAMKQVRDRLQSENAKFRQTRYVVANGALSRAGDPPKPIANFDARVVEDRVVDDGVAQHREFEIEMTTADGTALGRRTVEPAEFEKPTWVINHFGATANLYESPSELRSAIVELSKPASTTVYTHTGWREVDGRPVFLHAAGAVGAAEVRTRLDGNLSRYVLPSNGIEPAAALRAALKLLDVGPPALGVMLLAAVALAPLQHWLLSPFMLLLFGPSGGFKSTLAEIPLSFFGQFQRGILPMGFESTFAAMETFAFRAKDMLGVFDDFVPKTTDPRSEAVEKMHRFTRAFGNRSSRSRMTSSMDAQPDRPPRCLALATGEERPLTLTSIAARTIGWRVRRHDIDLGVLTALQHERSRFPNAMLGYVEYLATQYSVLGEILERGVDNARILYEGLGGHSRIPGALAHLHVAMTVLGDAGLNLGAWNREELHGLLDRVKTGLRELGDVQAAAIGGADPVDRFLDVLEDLVVQDKAAFVAATQAAERGAEPVGWRDAKYYYVRKGPAYRLVNGTLRRAGQGDLGMGEQELYSALLDRGIVLPGNEPERPFERRVTNEGERTRVVMLRRGDASPRTINRRLGGQTAVPQNAMAPDHDSQATESPPPSQSSAPSETVVVVAGTGGVVVMGESGRVSAIMGSHDGLAGVHWVGHDLQALARDIHRTTGRGPSRVTDTRVLSILTGDASAATPVAFEQLCERFGIACDDRHVATRALAEHLEVVAENQGQSRIARLEAAVLSATAAMESRGIAIDRDAWTALAAQRTDAMHRLREDLQEELGVDPDRDIDIPQALQHRGLDVESTGKAILARHRDEPVVAKLGEYRAERAFTRDVAPSILNAIVEDGRVRAALDQLGTVTGRFTSSHPNLLGVEKRQDVRRCFVASPGQVLVVADYSAIDLRVLAAISECDELTRVFVEGRDPHAETAAAAFGIPAGDISPGQRKAGKAINFAVVFGAGPEGLADYAAQVGANLDAKRAKEFIEGFRRRFAGVAAWQDRIRVEGPAKARSLWGRLRRFGPQDSVAPRLNAPVQMTTADGFKLAIVALHARLHEVSARLLLPFHDEVVVEAPADRLEEVGRLVEATMVEAMSEVLDYRVPVAVDVKTGPNWGDAVRLSERAGLR